MATTLQLAKNPQVSVALIMPSSLLDCSQFVANDDTNTSTLILPVDRNWAQLTNTAKCRVWEGELFQLVQDQAGDLQRVPFLSFWSSSFIGGLPQLQF